MSTPINNDAVRLLINPYSVIEFSDRLFEDHGIEGALEDWALKNKSLMAEIGVRDWLNELLHSLAGDLEPDYVRDSVINPYKGLHFSKTLQGDHETIIDRDTWLSANEKLMNEIGPDKWLWEFAKVLQNTGE